MRISVIGKQFPDSLARNLSFTLSRMGFQVQVVDEDALVGLARLRGCSPRLRALAELHPRVTVIRDRRVVSTLQRFRPEVVINTYADWHPRSVNQARSLLGSAVKLLFLYPDPVANLGREYPLAAEYDVLFFKDPEAVDRFRSRLGINAHYLPEACNPSWHCPVTLSARDARRYTCDLTTAGNMYYYRARLLEQFVEYDLKIWGDHLPCWLDSPVRAHYPGVFVAEREKAKAFQAAKIVLNTLTQKEVAGTNVRTFEAAGCGGFQIADWRPESEQLFKADEEIVYFHSREELRAKVDHYLRRPEERRRIAEAGRRRAHTEHTYVQRLQRAFQIAQVC